MTRTLINPPALHPAPGFSHAAVDEDAGIAYVSGQLGLRQDFSLAASDLGGQTRAAMENIKVVLDELGADWDHVMRRTIYTLQPTSFVEITAAIEAVQGSDRHPAQTLIGVTGLAIEGTLIEIEVTVALPSRRG